MAAMLPVSRRRSGGDNPGAVSHARAMAPADSQAATDEVVDRHRGLVGRTALVSILTLVSRLLGFVREVLAAALFGDTSAIWDAFVTAWRVPNLFRRFFGEGAISTSLQTALTEADADGGPGAGRRLFLGTARWLTVILVGVSLLAMALAWAVPDRVLGEDPEPVRELIVRLMPFVVLICLAAMCAGALNVRGHYATPSLAPALMNLVWIGTLVWIGLEFVWGSRAPPTDAIALKPYQLDMARVLAWGALASGAVQLLVQVPALARHQLLSGPAPTAAAPARQRPSRVLWASLPLALGAAVYQINVMIDGFMAEALLRDGAPTAHYLANRVQQFPLALIALAATSAVFPSLKALGHRGRHAELRSLHDRAQLGVCFLALPASVGLFLLATPMASVLFEHGAFGADGVGRVAAALRMLGPGPVAGGRGRPGEPHLLRPRGHAHARPGFGRGSDPQRRTERSPVGGPGYGRGRLGPGHGGHQLAAARVVAPRIDATSGAAAERSGGRSPRGGHGPGGRPERSRGLGSPRLDHPRPGSRGTRRGGLGFGPGGRWRGRRGGLPPGGLGAGGPGVARLPRSLAPLLGLSFVEIRCRNPGTHNI